MVGKHLMYNQGSGVQGVFEHELNEYKSVQVTRILHDFYLSDPKRGFYGGGGLDARINPQPAIWAMDSGGDLPRWGQDFKDRIEGFPRTMASTGHTTSLPLESNSVSIDPNLKDAWGIPAIRVTYKDHPDDNGHREILPGPGLPKSSRRRARRRSGAIKWPRTPTACICWARHAWATIRRPRWWTSITAPHDVPNLFLCDGSSFVTSGRGQPTMTIQALAFRAGDFIGQFAKRNEI